MKKILNQSLPYKSNTQKTLLEHHKIALFLWHFFSTSKALSDTVHRRVSDSRNRILNSTLERSKDGKAKFDALQKVLIAPRASAAHAQFVQGKFLRRSRVNFPASRLALCCVRNSKATIVWPRMNFLAVGITGVCRFPLVCNGSATTHGQC